MRYRQGPFSRAWPKSWESYRHRVGSRRPRAAYGSAPLSLLALTWVPQNSKTDLFEMFLWTEPNCLLCPYFIPTRFLDQPKFDWI